jgi:hypothetical protein
VGLRHVRPAIAALILLATPAIGHELGLAQVEGTFRRDGTYAVEVVIDLEHLSRQTSVAAIAESARLVFDGVPAKAARTEIIRNAGARPLARVRLTGRTPYGVSGVAFADAALTSYFVVKFRSEGQSAAVVAQWTDPGRTSAELRLDRAVVPLSRWQIVKLYLVLGFTHILPRGLDHVLFVLGIFLLSVRLKPVLWQVSAFTVAHTITLALTIYGFVSLPSSVVEPLIALSIVYVAVENVFTAKLHAWRPAVVFCFGLLHGMGFAGVLRDIGLPRSEFLPALLSFNAGVECGQLAVILVAFLALGLPFRNKPWYRRRIVIPGSLMIAAVGLYWAIERGSAAVPAALHSTATAGTRPRR